jgi:hypothetical protein
VVRGGRVRVTRYLAWPFSRALCGTRFYPITGFGERHSFVQRHRFPDAPQFGRPRPAEPFTCPVEKPIDVGPLAPGQTRADCGPQSVSCRRQLNRGLGPVLFDRKCCECLEHTRSAQRIAKLPKNQQALLIERVRFAQIAAVPRQMAKIPESDSDLTMLAESHERLESLFAERAGFFKLAFLTSQVGEQGDTLRHAELVVHRLKFRQALAVKRFMRIDRNTIRYEATVTDPKTWTRPWTVMRMLLGARSVQVIWLFLRRAFVQLAIGLTIGIAAALGVGQLQSFLFQTSPRDPVTLAAIVFLLAVVAVAACIFPAWRATRLDPAVALRYE